MEEPQNLIISSSILDKLRCSICNGYLSCAPILLLSNGKTICGRCSPSGDDGPTSRQFAFETLLTHVLFPCLHVNNGCPSKVPFGQVNEHAAKCIYQSKACPISFVSSDSGCKWNGPWPQITNHILENHPEYVMKKPLFIIGIGYLSQGFFMAESMGINFLISYSYNQLKKRLRYLIQYLPSFRDPKDEYLKIRLTNVSDRTFSYTFNGGKCVPFNTDFFEEGRTSLNLTKFLEILSHPEYVEFEVTIGTDRNVDCKMLECLKCKECHGFLIPPIFDCEQGIICYDCFDNHITCKSSNSEELKEIIEEQNYPCRWPGCDFIDKSINIRKHELECRFCIYQCPGTAQSNNSTVFIENCESSFTSSEAISHFEKHLHKFQYFGGDEYHYKVTFGKTPAEPKFSIFTLRYARVILIQGLSGRDQHIISVRVSEGYTSPNGRKMYLHPIRCSLQFEHSHCKSKAFTVSGGKIFTINNLPPCFVPDECIKVTLKLFQDIISI